MNDFERFIAALSKTDTVTLQLQGVGEEQFDTEMIHRAIQELLERQTPTKVRGISMTWDGRVGNCPRCKGFVTQLQHLHCCPHSKCGQSLAW